MPSPLRHAVPEFGMPAQPPLEDHSTIRLAQGAASNPTAALYRAALGPLNTQRYLALFERFDAAGRASLVWNPAAGLLTLNWMAFRGLWGAALVYLAAAEGLALLVLGLGRQYLEWPAGVEIGVLGSLLMLSILVPGLYGNALLHADIRRRMASAVTDAQTVREACEALERQAPTRQRLKAFVLGNALLGVLVVAVFFGLRLLSVESTAPAAALPVPEAVSPSVSAPAPPADTTTAVPPVLAPQPLPLTGPPGQDAVVEPVPEPSPSQPQAGEEAAQPILATAPAPAAKAPPPARPPSASSAPATAVLPEPARTPPPVLVKPSDVAAHGINVGLFAEEANAIKVHAQLTEAGLPTTMQTVEGTRGPRTRVRAGPFPDRASADAAAQHIRAMGLEAQIYRQ